MTAIDQGDIGLCDECGSDVEPRRRMLVDGTLSGAQVRIYAWVCQPCRELREQR